MESWIKRRPTFLSTNAQTYTCTQEISIINKMRFLLYMT